MVSTQILNIVKSNRPLQLALCVAVSFAAGFIGSIVTIANIPTWYAALDKPPLNPPNEIFGPVWSLLYLLMGVALYLVVLARASQGLKRSAYGWFAIQLALNTAWSFAFFGLHLAWLGFIVIIGLLAAIIMTIISFEAISKWAARLLYPYLLWVSFATYLTLAIALRN